MKNLEKYIDKIKFMCYTIYTKKERGIKNDCGSFIRRRFW